MSAERSAGIDEAVSAVEWVFNLQCPVRSAEDYIDPGAYYAHLWWQTVLGGALRDLRARSAALNSVVQA